ncbi:MAG TPA: glycosyltransferase family 39 protein [Candidatus Woesebacteria bacterium]|nr:glycosyltransferase family 39 protein [Candidatus Woesebacteria bacterium]
MKNKILIILLVICFFFLRLYKIEERVNFSMDQGIFLLRSWEIWQNKEITLIGPTASPLVHGHQFFQGPLIYYSMIMVMLVSGWNIIRASYLLVLLNFVALVFLYLSTKKIFNKKVAKIASCLFIFLPTSINFSNFLWNPNFLLILMPIFIFLGSKAFFSKKYWYLIWGILGGICLQFHFQVVLILFFTFLFLILKKIEFKKFLLFVGGAIIGYSPLLIFDLRNNFYNVRTMLEWLRFGGDEKMAFPLYYFLSFVPFLCMGLAWLIGKIKNKMIIVLLLSGLVLYSFYIKINQKEALGMPNGWNYVWQQKVVDKILEKGCPKNFNIASTISGDTRSYDLRFLMTAKSCRPMNVEEYPKAEKLFLVAPIDRPPETEKVWEVSSLRKFKINQKTEINSNVFFYELEREI